MKTCVGCRYAKWEVTSIRRLHPSGRGKCKYPYKVPKLPACMYWVTTKEPKPCGGYINRHDAFKDHCVYYQAQDERKKK